MVYASDLEILLIRVLAGEDPQNLRQEIQDPLQSILSHPTGQGYRGYALSLAGVIAREAGELILARQWFEESVAYSTAKGAQQLLAGTLLHMAKLYLLQGEEHEADRCLNRALSICETKEFEVFWDWHAETVYSLCQRALLKHIHPNWALHLLRRWFPERIIGEAGRLLIYSDENIRTGIIQLLQDAAGETDRPIIHLICLGEFHVFVNGREIPSARWKTKKAENLFKFLIINRQPYLKAAVTEPLWPNSDSKSGDASLRMALTHVRKALGLKDMTEESIILKRGLVYFNPEMIINTDYELFTTIALSALEDPKTTNPVTLTKLEQAAGLYQGEFLPDNLYDDWTVNMRNQLQQLYLRILLKQAEDYHRQGKLTPAIQACRRYLALEPTDELVNRKAMELLWQNGQKQQALSLYLELAAVLTKEYDLTPEEETSDLYEKIRCT